LEPVSDREFVVTSNNRVLIEDLEGYYRAAGSSVAEARWVLSRELGHPLARDEFVHHINLDTMDNRLENLIVVTPHEHAQLYRRKNARQDKPLLLVECLKLSRIAHDMRMRGDFSSPLKKWQAMESYNLLPHT